MFSYHVVASKVEKQNGIVLVARIKHARVVFVQVSRQSLRLGEEVDVGSVGYVKDVFDKGTVDVLERETPLYRYSKADLDDAEALVATHGGGRVAEDRKQGDHGSAELGTELWVVFSLHEEADGGVLLQQHVRGVCEEIEDIFCRHPSPARVVIAEEIDGLRDVVKDVEGRGEVARGVGVPMVMVLGVLDNDVGFCTHSPDTDPGSVAANIYTQAAGSKAC